MDYGPNVCVNGTPTHNGGYAAVANAFDGQTHPYAQNWNSVPYWIQYDLGEGVTARPRKYLITGSIYCPSYVPTAWVFEGSNDESEWDELDSQEGITWSEQYEVKEFEFENSTDYRFLRWTFTAQSVAICIGELEVMGSSAPVAAAPANFLMTRSRDRFRKKGISLGLPLSTDRYSSFLIARHNRLRTLGVSLEPAIPAVYAQHIMPVWFTANDAPSPWVASAKSEYSPAYAAYQAFRMGTGNSRWSNNGGGSSGAWIKIYTGGKKLLVTKMFLRNYPGQGVNGFKVQGSDDDSLWNDIYQGSAADNDSFQYFSFANAIPYLYHRLYYVGPGYNGAWTSLYALAFYSPQRPPAKVNFDTFDTTLAFGITPDFSNGNLSIEYLTGGWAGAPATMGKNSGKWYFEITCDDAGVFKIGLLAPGLDATGYHYYSADGKKCNLAYSYTMFGDAYDVGDVIGVAVDLDARKLWFSKNGVWQASGDPEAGNNEAFTMPDYMCWRPFASLSSSGVTANFGASAFEYDVPAGFCPGWYRDND